MIVYFQLQLYLFSCSVVLASFRWDVRIEWMCERPVPTVGGIVVAFQGGSAGIYRRFREEDVSSEPSAGKTLSLSLSLSLSLDLKDSPVLRHLFPHPHSLGLWQSWPETWESDVRMHSWTEISSRNWLEMFSKRWHFSKYTTQKNLRNILISWSLLNVIL